MAALTWRNVDAPSFASANQLYALSADLMNKGFDSANRGIEQFRETTTDEQSAALMADVMAAGNDPAAIAAATQGRNTAFLSPDALRFTNNQPGVMLEREGLALQNTGRGLSNTISGQQIRLNDFNYGNDVVDRQRLDTEYAQMPEALGAMEQIRTGMASDDPAVRAAAAAQQGSFLQTYGQTLGLDSPEQLSSFLEGNLTFEGTTRQNNLGRLQYAAGLDTAVRADNAEGIMSNILGMSGNDPQEAIRRVQALTNLDPRLQMEVLQQLTTYAAAMPASSGNQALFDGLNSSLGTGTRPGPLPTTYEGGTGGNRAPSMLSNALTDLVDRTEGGGAYNTLYGNAQRGNSPVAGTDVSQMTLGDLYQFSSRDGAYGRHQVEKLGYLATPMGRHQIVGQTLRATAQEMGLPENTVFTPEVQDAMFDHIASRAISGPQTMEGKMKALRGQWEGFKNVSNTELSAAITAYEGGEPSSLGSLSGLQTGEVTGAYGAGPTRANADLMGQTGVNPLNPGAQRTTVEGAEAAAANIEAAVTTMTRQVGDQWMNIPLEVDGEVLPEDQAMLEFQRGNNPALGAFQSQRQAEDAASRAVEMLSGAVSDTPAVSTAAAEEATAQTNAQLNEALTPTLDDTINIEDYPARFTSDEDGFQFMLDAGIYPEGTTLADIGPAPEGTSVADDATARLNTMRKESGIVDNNAEIRVNDRTTIPAAVTTGSQASQDWANMQRQGAIDSALGSIRTRLATSGGAAPLPGAMASAWDYFMTDVPESETNAKGREVAGDALEWFQSDQAREFFRENPTELTAADADPSAYASTFGQTESQRAFLEAQEGGAGTADPGMTDDAPAAPQELSLRDLTAAETIDQKFNLVDNFFSANANANPYAGVTEALQNRQYSSESLGRTLARITAGGTPASEGGEAIAGGVFEGVPRGDVSDALEQIMDEMPGMNSAMAGAILEHAMTYNRNWFVDDVMEVDMDEVRRIADLFRDGEQGGIPSYAPSISRMQNLDLSEAQQEQLATLRTAYENNETALMAIINNPRSSQGDVEQASTLLEQVRARADEELAALMAGGGSSNNLRAGTTN